MKKSIWIGIGIVILLALAVLFLRVFSGGEDNWIKDDRGVYVKHGNPSTVPDYVLQQKTAVTCALDLYEKAKLTTMFGSQCLGICGDYAVDMVNVPRTAEDDKPENQCADFREGKVHHFIEIYKEGSIVRIG